MNARPYQQRAIEAIEEGWKEVSKQLLVLPTGGGKTIVFSWLAQRRQPEKTLILAHRDELIDQAIAKLHAATGVVAGKEKAEWEARRSDPVVVASIQTMVRRLDKWPMDHFGLMVVDEAHHAISDSYQSVLRHFDHHADVLGVTATPDRGDKKNLGKYFEKVANEVGLFDLIHDGYLAPIRVKSVPIEIDLNNVRQSAGDYNETDLGGALAPYLPAIASAIAEHAGMRRTLAFLPLRATSRAFVDACRAAGLSAQHIDGDSPDRKEILADFAGEKYQVLSNAMLLTEGFDDPGIDCILVLRPTRSRSLYSQMVGRGTRTSPGKPDLLLLDLLWMHEKHSLVRPAHLVAKTDEEAKQITMRLQDDEAAGGEDLEEAASAVREEREEKLRRELAEKAKRKAKTIDPAVFASLVGDMGLAAYEPELPWEGRPMTEPQAKILERFGFDTEAVRGRGHASKLIDTVIQRSRLNLCTPKQARLLGSWGIADANKVAFDDAKRIIDQRIGKRPVTV